MFRVDSGNILYTPNIEELTRYTLQSLEDTKMNPFSFELRSLSNYHQINWLSSYKQTEAD